MVTVIAAISRTPGAGFMLSQPMARLGSRIIRHLQPNNDWVFTLNNYSRNPLLGLLSALFAIVHLAASLSPLAAPAPAPLISYAVTRIGTIIGIATLGYELYVLKKELDWASFKLACRKRGVSVLSLQSMKRMSSIAEEIKRAKEQFREIERKSLKALGKPSEEPEPTQTQEQGTTKENRKSDHIVDAAEKLPRGDRSYFSHQAGKLRTVIEDPDALDEQREAFIEKVMPYLAALPDPVKSTPSKIVYACAIVHFVYSSISSIRPFEQLVG